MKNVTLNTTFQLIATAGTPVDLFCSSAVILANSSTAAAGDQATLPASTIYPTTGDKDIYAKVAAGTATLHIYRS